LLSATPTRVDLVVGGVRRVVDVTTVGTAVYVDSAAGHDALTEAERFPDPGAAAHAGSLLAPMPGTVIRVDVAVGDVVTAGAAIVTIEAMKMEHAIRSPGPGTVTTVSVTVGAQVDSGTVLAVVEEETDG
jgi:biotin carboxyl carrier protein